MNLPKEAIGRLIVVLVDDHAIGTDMPVVFSVCGWLERIFRVDGRQHIVMNPWVTDDPEVDRRDTCTTLVSSAIRHWEYLEQDSSASAGG